MAGVEHKASLALKSNKTRIKMDGLLQPLRLNEGNGLRNGIVFPLTPTIQVSHSANYGTYDVAGSIAQQNYYMNTPNASLSVTAMFASNTVAEALYTAAALQFFKTCTKSDFGSSNMETAGTPPPILSFNCYGTLHAKNVPVVLRSFTYTLPEDTDYVTVEVNGESISVPTLVLVSIELSPQLTPSKVKSKFNITSFASGRLLNGGNTGGFI
jgi:hypothetical protein|tara:strand:- start:786 stop:1421 length:636 start_codon:yes stop_codon:yes gene_type:complete